MQPIKTFPPPEARDWRTLRQRKYTEYRRNYYDEHHQYSPRTIFLAEFHERLKKGIRNVYRQYKNQGLDMKCGCWFDLYTSDLTEIQEPSKQIWKRYLRELGWISHVSYERAYHDTLPFNHPNNRKMFVKVAWAEADENHEHEPQTA